MRITLQRLWLVVALGSGMSATVAEAQLQINEDFGVVPPANWVVINHSAVVGSTSWFQGNPAVFPAQAGATNSYAGANFNSTTGTNTINTWLLTPQVNLANGVIVTFYTRTVPAPAFPDRLELRLSTNGASTNVGTLATDVGDFTTLLLSVNPTLTLAGYPNVWTQFTATLAGLPAGITPGRVAFRYFVTSGGPTGANSDYIGVDTVTMTDPPGPPATNYFTVVPCRVVDTRGGAPLGPPVMTGQETRTFAVGGNCGIPATAKAISINVTVTQPTATGNIRLFAAGQPVPTVSTINYSLGQTRGNNAIVPLDATGAMAAFIGQGVGTTVHLIVDVNGYFQ